MNQHVIEVSERDTYKREDENKLHVQFRFDHDSWQDPGLKITKYLKVGRNRPGLSSIY